MSLDIAAILELIKAGLAIENQISEALKAEKDAKRRKKLLKLIEKAKAATTPAQQEKVLAEIREHLYGLS